MTTKTARKLLVLSAVLVLACAMIFSGCKLKKKTPEEIFSSALTTSEKAFEERNSIADTIDTLKNGLFTVTTDGGDMGLDLKLYFKDGKFAVDTGILKDLLGVDLNTLKDKFSGSLFGTEGANLTGISKADEQKLIDAVEKIVKAEDIDFNAEIIEAVKENCEMTAEYGQKVALSDREVKADILNMTFTFKQVKDIVSKIIDKVNELVSSFSEEGIPADVNDLFGDKYNDEDKAIDLKVYTDVKTGEVLGGAVTMVDGEAEGEDLVINFDVVKDDTSVKYNVSGKSGEDAKTASLTVSKTESVETITVTVDGKTQFEYRLDRAAKYVSVNVSGTERKLNYDVEKAADGSIKAVTFSFEVSEDMFSMVGSMLPISLGGDSVYYGEADYYGVDNDDDVYYSDDYDWDPGDDYNWGEDYEPAMIKVNVRCDVDGTMPAYKDVLDLTQSDIENMMMEVFSS